MGADSRSTLDAVDQAVHRELIGLVFGTPSVPLINGVAIVVMAIVLGRDFAPWVALTWTGVALAVVVGRLVLWRRFRKPDSGRYSMDTWARWYTGATALTGLLWGLTATTVLVVKEPIDYVFAAFVVGGLCAGAAMRLSPHPPAVYAFIGTAAPPMVLALLLIGRMMTLAMGGLLLAFVVVMLLVGRENYQRLADSLRTKIEEEVLNASLQKATLDLTEQIAEKEKVALELEESSERFRAIGDNALDGIIIADDQGRVVYWNPAAERTFGYRAEEIGGKEVHSILAPPRDRENAVHSYAHFAVSGEGAVLGKAVRLRALRSNGEEFPVDLSVSAMQLGGKRHALGIVRDMSEQERTMRTLELVNQQMTETLAELRRRESELTTIARLSDQLQSCRKLTEAYPIIAEAAAALFASTGGSLARLNADTQELTRVTAWGPEKAWSLARFSEDDCCALRIDQEYETGPKQPVRCHHLAGGEGPPCFCLPLKVQGKTRGLLSVVLHQGGAFDDAMRQVVHSFADVVKLSLSNLHFRETLIEQAFRDPLTGLFNRRYLMETLPREIRRAQRRGVPLTIAMVDIDHFKRFNDVYGHDAGDLVLTELAVQFSSALRAEDVASRYGGEEFLFLLPECDLATAYQRLSEICAKAKSRVNLLRGRELPGTTLSIGLAALSENLAASESLITAADKAMYVAKRMGRDRIECFEASPEARGVASGK